MSLLCQLSCACLLLFLFLLFLSELGSNSQKYFFCLRGFGLCCNIDVSTELAESFRSTLHIQFLGYGM